MVRKSLRTEMKMIREALSRSHQMEICLRLLSTSIRMRFFLAIPDMQGILSDYIGTTGRRRIGLCRQDEMVYIEIRFENLCVNGETDFAEE